MTGQPTWARATSWRQGHVLDAGAAASLGLLNTTTPAETCVVVISHDCDLANDDLSTEPNVELIVGRVVPVENGSLAWGKSPRTLHMGMLRSGNQVTVELVTTNKVSVLKSALVSFVPDPAFELSARGRGVLRNWLAIRYNRGAFPDPFIDCMKDNKLDVRLANLMEKYGHVVSVVYFDIDGGRELTRSGDIPYELVIVLAVEPGDEPEDAMENGEKAAAEVDKLFTDKCFDKATEKWSHIHLKGCMAISEDELTVSRAKKLSQWRLEHLSLRADMEQPVPLHLRG